MGVVFTTPGIMRIFLGCTQCGRTVPHYRVYGRKVAGDCRCGNTSYRPKRLPEWQAAIWVLLVGWVWRKTILKREEWDPRMPLRARE